MLYSILNCPWPRNYGKYNYCIYVVHPMFLDHALWLGGFLRNQLPRVSGIVAVLLVLIAANVIVYWVAHFNGNITKG
jgi:isoprenylcysteine carboxyl methyltransferase (ICMT) family protein YpbQ